MARPSKRQRRSRQRSGRPRRDGGRSNQPQHAPRGEIRTVDGQSFIAARLRHGAEMVGVQEMFERSDIVWSISEGDTVSELCVALEEFIASAARNAGKAIEVSKRLEDAEAPHLVTALKKYVEDTGQALKEVDNRLKQRESSLAALFPEVAGDPESSTTWKELIRRRDVIAHQILSVDDEQVRSEANRDFGSLHKLLSNVFFAPIVSDWGHGRGFSLALRADVLRRLPAVEPDGHRIGIGESVVLVCEDLQEGLLSFRLGRSPEDKLLLASSRLGTLRLSVQSVERPESHPS